MTMDSNSCPEQVDAEMGSQCEFGLYQKILVLFQAPFAMFVTFVLFGQLFFYLYPRVYWCAEDSCLNLSSLTPEQRRNLSVPWSIANMDFDPCFKYDTKARDVGKLVRKVQQTCSNVLQSRRSRSRRRGPSDCDYEMAKDSAFVTRRLPRYAQYGGYGRNGYNEYYTSTEGYSRAESRDRYNRPFSTTIKTHVYVQSTRPTISTTPGRQNPRFNQSSSTRTSSQSRTWRKCPRTPLSLKLGRNFSINAESIANRTRDLRRGKKDAWSTLVRCRNWTWNMNPGEADPPYDTIVTEDRTDSSWLCNPERRITIANAIFYIGAIVGGIGIGFIADTRGRVPALVTANVLGCLGGALSAIFYRNFFVFLFFRFITGMAFDNCFTMIYILVLEYVGPTYRTLVANLSIAVFYTIGTLLLPALALIIGNWRIYALVISVPMSLALLAICIVPESARWLLSKGRTKEATRILRSFAKVNRKLVDEEIFREFRDGAERLYEEFSKEVEPSLWEAFKKPRIAKNFFFLTLIWALIALVYDGHSRNILNLGNNVFVSFAIGSSTEFPADMLLIFTLDRFGRRWLAFGSLVFSGAFSLVSAFIPMGMMTASLVTALISRFFVNVAFNIGLQYAAELLPTVIRAQGVNIIHIMGYVASIVSPFIASIGRTNPALSLSLLGILASIGGVLCLFLPETLGEELPNTLEEGQEFGKNQSFWNCPICAKPKVEDDQLMEPAEPTPVQLRNNMRASLRGEAFRSSIISTSSSHRLSPSHHLLMNPLGTTGNPNKLRRVYTQ